MDQQAAAQKTIQTEQPAGGQGLPDKVLFGEDIEIYPARLRRDLSPEGAQAFEARDRRHSGEQFVLLCGRGTIPRITNIASYRNLKNPHILKLLDAGVVDWIPERRQRFALVYERPPAKRLMESLDGPAHHMSEDRVVSGMIQPILSMLADLRNIDMVHGAINPMNLYFSGVDGAETAMLGECLSAAPSLRQHELLMATEQAMAQKSGRGMATFKDDLYAFGVCVAIAARGANLLAGKTPSQIIAAKLNEGSYSLLVGRDRISTAISEFLRGVLSDDEAQRWDVEDAIRWLEGRRLSPKQPKSIPRAARPLIFKNEKYWDLRQIARVFSQNISEAVHTIENDQFDLWIKRNFEDKTLEKRLEEIYEREAGSSQEKKIASICVALDPTAPVRYKHAALFPSGLGNALADAIARDEDIQVYGDILVQQMFATWINYRFDEIYDATGMLSMIEKCRNALNQKIPGYGMERVLYMTSKECACMSPLFKNFFVMGPGSLLTSLEAIARGGNRPENVFDRHMIAFLSVREAKMIDPFLGYITSQDRGTQVIGFVRALASIQRRFSTGLAPGLTNWMVSISGPAVDKFKDLEMRKEIMRKLEAIKDGGNLYHVLDLIDDNLVNKEDMQRFTMARFEFAALMREKEQITGYLRKRKNFGYATGRQVAMLISAFLATICILGYLAIYFMQGDLW